MKKISFSLIFLFFLIAPSVTFAQVSKGVGSPCTDPENPNACGDASLYCNASTFTCTAVPTSPPDTSTTGAGGNSNGSNTGTPASFVPLAPIPGLTTGVVANSEGLADFLNNLYRYLIGLAAALTIIMIIWGGLEYAAQESIPVKMKGKERIFQAILGLVLVLLPALVFGVINSSILNLSINVPPLDTSGVIQGTNGSNPPTTTTTTSADGKVTTNESGKYLKTATFTSNSPSMSDQAAQAWVAACKDSLWSAVTSAATCPGGFDSTGKCSGGSQTTAQCSLPSPTQYSFVDIDTGYAGVHFLSGYDLKPNDNDGEGFLGQCQADHGSPCVIKSSGLVDQDPCPSRSFSIPENAPNASGGGTCYKAALTCLSNDASVPFATFCTGSVTFTP